MDIIIEYLERELLKIESMLRELDAYMDERWQLIEKEFFELDNEQKQMLYDDFRKTYFEIKENLEATQLLLNNFKSVSFYINN